jgi:hypothetical protein
MVVHSAHFPLRDERGYHDGPVSVSRCRRCGIVIGYSDRCDFCRDRPSDHVDEPGEYIGRHHTEWSATVDEIIAEGDTDGAELLLRRLVETTEAEVATQGTPPAEFHFRRLAQLAERRDDPGFAAQVRERFERCRAASEEWTRAAS